jgi:hemolysin activation/secretion protein
MMFRYGMCCLLLLSSQFLQAAEGQRIEVRGVTVLSTAEVDGIVGAYSGREVFAEDIAAMINAFNNLYASKGYINSGMTFPEQAASSALVLQAVEGDLSRVDVQSSGRLSKDHIAAVIRSEISRPLNINELQTAFSRLEQESTIESVRGRLEPGVKPGEASLVLDVMEADAFSVDLRANNYRSPSVGSEQAQVQLNHINLTGHSDVLSIGLNVTEGMDSGSIYYSVPVSALKSRIAAFYSTGDTLVVEAPFDAISLKSETDTAGVSIETRFVDSLTRTISTSIGLEKKTSDTSLLGLPFDFTPGSVNGQSKATVVVGSVSYQQRSRQQALAAKLTLRQGIDAMGATISSTGAADGKFSLWQLQLSYIQLFERNGYDWTFSVAANSQFTNDTLQAFERFPLGGHGSIRGYRENQALRDQSWEIRTQLEMPLYQSVDGNSRFSLYPFVDVGEGRNAQAEDNVRQTVNLSSVGLGMNYTYSAFRANLEWAQRLQEKTKQGNTLQDKGIYVGVSYAL